MSKVMGQCRIPSSVQERLKAVLGVDESVVWCWPIARRVWWGRNIGCVVVFVLLVVMPIVMLVLRNILESGGAEWRGVGWIASWGLVYVALWGATMLVARRDVISSAYVITDKRALILAASPALNARQRDRFAVVSVMPSELRHRAVVTHPGGKGSILFWRRRYVDCDGDQVAEIGFTNIPDVHTVDRLLEGLVAVNDCSGVCQQDEKWCKYLRIGVAQLFSKSDELNWERCEKKSELRYKRLAIPVIVAVLAVSIVTQVVCLRVMGRDYLLCWQMHDAISVPGKVLRIDDRSELWCGEDYYIDVVYRYEVNGREYTSRRPTLFNDHSNLDAFRRDLGLRLLTALTNGESVNVYVHPRQPGTSVLDRTVGFWRVVLGMVLVVLPLMIDVAMLYLLIRRGVGKIGHRWFNSLWLGSSCRS